MSNLKIVSVIVGVILVAAVLAGLWWHNRGPDKVDLIIASGSQGGTYNAFAQTLADTVNELDGKIRATVVRSKGADDNVARMTAGSAHVGFIQNDTAVNRDITIAARLFPEMFHLIAHADANISSVPDLRGKRVALLSKGAGSNALFARLLNHYGVPPSEVTTIHGSLAQGGMALREGSVDALFVVIALGNSSVERIIDETNVNVVPIAQADAIALYDPALRAMKMPMGTYRGDPPAPLSDVDIVAVDSLLAVRRDAPKQAIEELTRILFEQRQNMLRKIPQAAFVTEPSETHKLAFDIHQGAESFFTRDAPPFVVEYAEPIALALSALVLLLSGIWQARVWLSDRRKNRADHYNLALIELTGRVEAVTSMDELESIRGELFAIFQDVMADIDSDKIEEKSLQSFSFAWDVASSTVNHRQLVLQRGG